MLSTTMTVCRRSMWREPNRTRTTVRSRLLLLEQRQVDGIGHRAIPGIVGVHVVAAVVGRQQPRRVARIAEHGVEVDHRIECSAGTDPVIDRLSPLLARRRPEAGKRVAFERIQRASVDFQPQRTRAIDALSITLDYLRDAHVFRRETEGSGDEDGGIALQYDDISRSGLHEDVSIESRE